MARLARSQGLKPVKSNEHELIGDAALYATVKRRIRSASRRLEAGDLFLLTFSGHGNSYDWGHIPVLQERQEPSTETWCLYDNEIFDRELGALWTEFAEG